MFIFFHSAYVYGGLQCGGPLLGAGNPMLRTNTRYGSCFHRAHSPEWKMYIYLEIMQEKVHSLVGAWFREP